MSTSTSGPSFSLWWTPWQRGPGLGDGDARGGEKLKNWSPLIGIVFAISGNILIALAINVQRYAHLRLSNRLSSSQSDARGVPVAPRPNNSYGAISNIVDESETQTDDGLIAFRVTTPDGSSLSEGSEDDDMNAPSTYLKSSYWWLGQILFSVGELGNFLAYGFAPASIVSPMGVVALVSNCVIAPFIFHEAFRQQDVLGVLVAVGGVVTVVLSAGQEEHKLGPQDVWNAITTTEFEIYTGINLLLIATLVCASWKYGQRIIFLDLGLVGLFGGYTVLSVKGISSMLSSTLFKAFTTPVTYLLLVVLAVTAVLQIHYINRSLQRFDSTLVIPIQFVMFTLCVICGSAVLYRDFERTTHEQAAKFVGGCLLTFFGVFMIARGRGPGEEEAVEGSLSDVDGMNETIGLANQDGTSHPGSSPRLDVARPIAQSRRSSRASLISFMTTQGVPVGSPRSPMIHSPRVGITTAHGQRSPFSETASLLHPFWSHPPREANTGT